MSSGRAQPDALGGVGADEIIARNDDFFGEGRRHTRGKRVIEGVTAVLFERRQRLATYFKNRLELGQRADGDSEDGKSDRRVVAGVGKLDRGIGALFGDGQAEFFFGGTDHMVRPANGEIGDNRRHTNFSSENDRH